MFLAFITVLDSKVNELIPYGQGIKYFEDGKKNMEGSFGDWFIVTGTEYYKNGNIRFIESKNFQFLLRPQVTLQ